jgi:hypothetical protein
MCSKITLYWIIQSRLNSVHILRFALKPLSYYLDVVHPRFVGVTLGAQK